MLTKPWSRNLDKNAFNNGVSRILDGLSMVPSNTLSRVCAIRLLSKLALGLFLAGFLLCVFSYEALCDVQAPTVQGWQIEDRGGYFFESGGVIRFWSDGGSNCPSLILYKQIAPMGDFNFSLQVNAATLESFGVFVRSNLPFSGGKEGFNFEFGHYGAGMFLLARRTLMDDWLGSHFADGVENVWYTMHLSVHAESFSVEATVLDENGTLLGSYSASDMSNISFEDIKYIGFGVWGYSPTDYSVRNIVDPFANPSCISISAEASSTTAGSAVDVTGILSDSNGTALPNKLVVLSYTFPGIDSWIPISSCLTDETGEYSIQWINSASGTFTLKTEWSGGGTYIGASNTSTLSFLPYDSRKVFFVESNSTISALAFNSTSSELSFTASGPSGTSGYVKPR
jgi:hypothetical protein